MKHYLDPRVNGVTNATISEWRQQLKRQLLIEREYRSDWSGMRLTVCEMHEGIIPRVSAPRGLSWHYMIFHPFNSFLLLPNEHRPKPPNREWCITKSFERYGKEAVVEWFYSLPWRRVPFRIENFGVE